MVSPKRPGPDFFLDIVYRSQNNRNNGEDLREDLTRAFHFLANYSEMPLPYNYEFIRWISEDPARTVHQIENKYGAIISAPQNLLIWKQLYTQKLKENYYNWAELIKQRHVFSYFVVAHGDAGFIGVLQARIEKDQKNVPDNHITGYRHPPYIRQTAVYSFRLVKFYLISTLKIPEQCVHEALRTVVILWEESLLSQFTDLFGSSFSFVFSALFFTCAMQNLIENGVVAAIDSITQAPLKPIDIQIPSDTIMSGSFLYNQIPNEFTWRENGNNIATKIVNSVPTKINSALTVNSIYPLLRKFILPHGVSLSNSLSLLEPQPYCSQRCPESKLLLIPIKDFHELIHTLFPMQFVLQPKKLYPVDFQADMSKSDLSGKNLRGANLTGVNLTGANLTGADLQGTNLTGANFTGANLTGADLTEANLRGADFKWSDLTRTCLRDADLRGANFREANFNWTDLKDADLRGSNFKKTCLRNVNLEKANLTGSELREVDFKMANLTGAELRGTELKGAAFEKVNLVNTCMKQVDFAEANLVEANLTGTDFTGANLQRVNLAKANCTQTNLERANLSGANMAKANLTGANLVETILRHTNLEKADLTEANLAEAKLTSANLRGADLTKANLREANLRKTNLIDADLTEANLEGADLTEAQITGVFLVRSSLKGTRISAKSREYLEKLAAKEQINLDEVIWV